MVEFSVYLQGDMKYGIRNFPERICDRNICKLTPSKGKVPHIKAYNTTPKL